MKHKIKQYARLNLFQRLFLTLVSVLACICILITGGFTLYFRQETKETIDQSIRQSSQINAQNISQSINQIELAVASLNTEQSGLQEKLLLYNDNDDGTDTIRSLIVAFNQTVELLNNYVSIALRSFTTRYHVYFFADPSYEMYEHLSLKDIENPSLDGQTWMYSSQKVCDTDWYRLSMESSDRNHWFIQENEPKNLYFSRCLNYMTVNEGKVENITLGVILIIMDTSWIQTGLNASDLTSDTTFLLMDNAGSILYQSDNLTLSAENLDDLFAETHETHTINDKKYSIETTDVTSDLKLITLLPAGQLHENYKRILLPFLILFIITLIIGTLFSAYLSHRMTKDILYLARHMRVGDLTTIKPERLIKDKDIDLLYQNYNLLVTTTTESMRQKLEYAEYQKEMELNLLQAQINPHFLCNSLNSIYNVAMLHKEGNIASALSSLCTYLRYNVSSPNIEVTLQQELDMLEKYISLQNFLCGDCIFFDYDIMAVNPQQTKIPKMLLQPLVENSIMHNGNNEFVEINITCTVNENVLRLIVKDNGTKIEADSINSSLSNINAHDTKLRSHGVGIQNVHQRIKLKYGEQYGLHYITSGEGGIAACIELPVYVATTSESI